MMGVRGGMEMLPQGYLQPIDTTPRETAAHIRSAPVRSWQRMCLGKRAREQLLSIPLSQTPSSELLL